MALTPEAERLIDEFIATLPPVTDKQIDDAVEIFASVRYRAGTPAA